ncbi:MAG: FprA family A-type flavoprotein [Clostridia bacterium]|nr:FprA family A-type flavoprotein [Clostridia bacterium]
MPIINDLYYVGVFDRRDTLFEAQYPVPDGISYNSYVLMDDRVAVFDTVDGAYTEEWLGRLHDILQGRTPDYLIVSHMEPDHSAGIAAFAARYPKAMIFASHKAFQIMRSYYGDAYETRQRVIVDGDTLTLGRHELTFYSAPMVHWPEVTVTYDRTDGTLFSADAFGRFGPLDDTYPWDDEAARYYFGIVGKFGSQVTALLKKLAKLPIARICPLHGPTLTDIPHALARYTLWASYRPEKRGTVIAYASVYGHTAAVVNELRAMLKDEVVTYDLVTCDMTKAVADAFRYDTLIVAAATYNMDVFPPMRTFLHHLKAREFQQRTVGFIENGTWAPMAATVMRRLLEKCDALDLPSENVTVRGTLDTLSREKLRALAAEINERHDK